MPELDIRINKDRYRKLLLMNEEWKDKRESFEILDGRGHVGNFLQTVLKKCENLAKDTGICVIQSFEPVPLYSNLSDLGFEHLTEKISDNEYRAYFYRTKSIGKTTAVKVPLHPAALANLGKTDKALGKIASQLWQLVWNKEDPAIDQKTKYLLSLANAVGAGRHRQATRELVKAYFAGVTVNELDELFSLFVWNQGIGHFASEIGPSQLFSAYQLIKRLESEGKSRDEVMAQLIEKFGESNPDVSVLESQ
jgi:alkylhydroperoxidase/carboxymuconolactone decarboxylase family protein YurZ